jgi:cobalt-zinc-cadmium efflux system protein
MHTHDHNHAYSDISSIKAAFFINLAFTSLEIVGGLLINSVAILSDALHDLGDSFSLGLAWFLANYAERGSNEKYSYGYRRFSLLGALFNALILLGGSLIILSQAIPRLSHPESFSAPGMIAFAVVGVTVNGYAALRLRGTTTANARVVGLHLLEDVLGWAAVLIVGVVSLIADLPILDPILSILITLFMLVNVLSKFKTVAELFLQAVPGNASLKTIRTRLEALDGVQSTHHIHLWSLDGEHHVLTAHLVVDDCADRETVQHIKSASKDLIDALDLDIEHVTLEIDYADEDCSMVPNGVSHAH